VRKLALAALASALIAGLTGVGGAVAQDRAPLPAWTPGLDVDALATNAGVTLPAGRTTVTLSGTITSTVDGLRYDALYRFTEGGAQRVDLLVLPPGARVVDEDVAAHTYVVDLGAARSLRIDPSVIARHSLSTVSEVRDGLRGAIVVDVTTDPMAVMAALPSPGPPAGAAAPLGTAALVGLSALAAGAPALLFAFIGYRRRRTPVDALSRRVFRAADAVEREAKRLGPAFVPLVTSAADARQEGRRLVAAHRTAARARRRLSAFGGTGKRRFVDLDQAERDALQELTMLVDRLEDVAVSIASHDARHENSGDAEAALRSLTEELDVVLSADEEARAVA